MAATERGHLVAPCGIDCGNCALHLSGGNPALMERLRARGIPQEKLPCAGCRDVKGDCPVLAQTCETYQCVVQRGVTFCHECVDFPCSRLCPSSDRADVLPHNLKLFNLCTIQRSGVDAFTKVSAELERVYFKGKMQVGRGPRLEA